ncbi:MAG: hypothetical protein VW907_09685 [Opitutae bacterium]
MRRKQNKRHRVFKGFLLLAVLLLTPSTSAHVAPCLSYAYTSSGNHLFLMGNNSSMFGDNLTVVHNCDNVSIELNGEFYAFLSTRATIPLNPGLNQFTFTFDNRTVEYQNVMVYPDYLKWEETYQWEVFREGPELIEKSLLEARINWAVFFGIAITWVLCVYVYWNLINSFTQRNFIEEVVQ